MQRISIITPVLNEEDMIIPFLDHLAGLQGSFELIVVDGEVLTRPVLSSGITPGDFLHRCTFL